MSQRTVEQGLGKLATDPVFCARFFRNPAGATWEAGLPVSPVELEALSTVAEAAVAHFGGPVQPQLGTVLFCPPAGGPDLAPSGAEIAPGLVLTQHVDDLTGLAAAPPERLRLFLGYAGWGEGQLMEEILRNDWLTAAIDLGFLFAGDPSRVWAAALRSVGVDPAVLPSWTQGGGHSAN